jgi:hypothetical protein
VNAYTFSIAELIGKLLAGFILVKIGIKNLNFLGYSVGFVGVLAMMILHTNDDLIPYLLFCMRMGTALYIVASYMSVILLIPT